jgi:hypothetical protein
MTTLLTMFHLDPVSKVKSVSGSMLVNEGVKLLSEGVEGKGRNRSAILLVRSLLNGLIAVESLSVIVKQELGNSLHQRMKTSKVPSRDFTGHICTAGSRQEGFVQEKYWLIPKPCSNPSMSGRIDPYKQELVSQRRGRCVL